MLQSYHKLQIVLRYVVMWYITSFALYALMYYSGFINRRVIGFENLEGAMQSVTQ